MLACLVGVPAGCFCFFSFLLVVGCWLRNARLSVASSPNALSICLQTGGGSGGYDRSIDGVSSNHEAIGAELDVTQRTR